MMLKEVLARALGYELSNLHGIALTDEELVSIIDELLDRIHHEGYGLTKR